VKRNITSGSYPENIGFDSHLRAQTDSTRPCRMKPFELEILRTGLLTSNSGYKMDIAVADLQAIADGYDPTKFRAPLIISHNTQGIPDQDLAEHPELAYGTPDSLKVEGNRLKALFKKYSPKVKKWFDDGSLLSVSSSLYLPNSPNNPNPGKPSLRHIAGLGKTPPAAQGMATPSFSQAEWVQSFGECEGAEDFVIEFAATPTPDRDELFEKFCELFEAKFNQPEFSYRDAEVSTLFQRLRELLIEKYDAETADRILPSWAVGTIAQEDGDVAYLQSQVSDLTRRIEELESEESETTASYEEMPQPTETTAEPTAAELQIQQDRRALAQREADLNRREFSAFVETELRGKLVPAIATTDQVVNLMETLYNGAVEFSGEATAHPLEQFKTLLRNLPVQVEFSEVAKGAIPETATAEFSATATKAAEAYENAWKGGAA
jgi:hypothetical protein